MGRPDVLKGTRIGEDKVLVKGRTPVRVERMVPYLSRYPDREKAMLLTAGFREGFVIPPPPHVVPPSLKNLPSAKEHPEVVRNKIGKEVALGRMAGPFEYPPWEDLVVSPLGVIPKREAGKFRLIQHLSYPKGLSVNDGIDPTLCSVEYTSFDAAVKLVQKCGPGALMAKTDIESAFRLLPVNQGSLRLLGCYWEGAFYVDRCLPMGCSISCAYFEAFSSFLEWVMRDIAGSETIIHYLDDFFCVAPGDTKGCLGLLKAIEWVCGHFGVPLAPEKTEGPSTTLCFLGIEIDSKRMECRLPREKVVLALEAVEAARKRKKVTLRELQAMLGRLSFACRIIPMGRVFSRRLAIATAGVKAPHHFVRIGKEHKEDLGVWSSFLKEFNGRTLMISPTVESAQWELYTDAAGGMGYGAFLGGKWSAESWPARWVADGLVRNLALLELFPIVVAVELWGDRFRNSKVRFHCDNMGVVMAINQVSASSPPVVRLLRHLVLRCMSLNAWVVAIHVPGVSNVVADSLSRQQWGRFRQLVPTAEATGIPCPGHLWDLAYGQ
ncbi:RNA-mediated [Pristimantis euphronides]